MCIAQSTNSQTVQKMSIVLCLLFLFIPGTASAPCTDGAIALTYAQDPPASCECGSSICKYGTGANSVKYNHRWCEVASSTCADYPICSNTDASAALVAPDYSTLAGFNGAGARSQWEALYCQCGTEKCEFNRANPSSHEYLKSKEYCDAASSRCTFEPCGNTDGTKSNPLRCQCGLDDCIIGRYGVSEPSGGYYCNAANHICGATKDVNKFSITVPAVIGPDLYPGLSPAPMNYYTKCSSVAGTVAITDFVDCAEAAVATGAPISKVTHSDYAAGCLLEPGYEGSKVYFNDMPEQFTRDETTYKMICKAGTLCPNIGGSATNVNKCVCGSKECAPGSTCKSSESLCTLVNQAEKIAEIETNQKTCCAKNAASCHCCWVWWWCVTEQHPRHPRWIGPRCNCCHRHCPNCRVAWMCWCLHVRAATAIGKEEPRKNVRIKRFCTKGSDCRVV
jgi:hypothetical protein